MTRNIGIALVIAAAAALALLDIQPDRTLDLSSNFGRATAYISVLGPPTRVGEDAGGQRFFAEPVYFDLRLPVWFSRARVEAVWSKDPSLPDPKLGIALDPSDDRIDGEFALFPTERMEKRGERFVSSAELDLSSLPRSRYGYRLFFSIPGVDPDTPFYLHRVVIRAERQSFIAELRRVIRSYLSV